MFAFKQLVLVVLLLLQCALTRIAAQDTSALITGILGSLTSTTRNQGCPGECVHAITALLCEQTLSEGQCDAAYLRCCITKSVAATAPPETPSDALPTMNASLDAHETPATKPTPQPLKSGPDPEPQLAPAEPQPSNATTSLLGDRVEPDVVIETITASNETKPSSGDASAESNFKAGGPAIGNINCPGTCISETFAAYCRAPIADDGLCEPGGLCCATENDEHGQTVTAGQASQPTKQAADEIEKKAGSPIECTGSCVSSLFSLFCDKVDYTATCNSGGVCCLNTGATSTTPPPPPPPPSSGVTLPSCAGRCLPGFMHTVCRSQGNQVSTETTTCPPATICCLDSPAGQNAAGAAGGGDVYTNDRGPDGPGIILTGAPSNARNPFAPGGSNGFVVPPSLGQQQPQPPPTSSNSEMFGIPRPIQEETVGPISSAELVTKIASTIQCPGSCIAPLMKFTCFGSNNVFPHFKCGEGYVCCADTSDVKRTLSSAIILNQVGVHPPPPPPPPPADNGLFSQRPSNGLGDLPVHGDNKLNPSSEPQESQLQPVNVRPPPNVIQNGASVLDRKPAGSTPAANQPQSGHGPQGFIPESPPLSAPPPSQGGFVPALRPRPAQGPASPSNQDNSNVLVPPPPTTTGLGGHPAVSAPVPAVSGTRLKIPSYQINAPGQSSFLGSKNFNRPFRPIGRPEPITPTIGTNPLAPGGPILTSGGFVPAGGAVSPSLTDSPSILPIPHSHPSVKPNNATRSKGIFGLVMLMRNGQTSPSSVRLSNSLNITS